MAESTATVASLASAILFVAAACSSVGQDPHKLGNIAMTPRLYGCSDCDDLFGQGK